MYREPPNLASSNSHSIYLPIFLGRLLTVVVNSHPGWAGPAQQLSRRNVGPTLILSTNNQQHLIISLLILANCIVCDNYYLFSTIISVCSTPVEISPLIKRRKIFYMASSAIPGDSTHAHTHVVSSCDYYSGVISYRTGIPEYNVLIYYILCIINTLFYISWGSLAPLHSFRLWLSL